MPALSATLLRVNCVYTYVCLCTAGNGGRLEYDNSMVVSMEINGLMYQGVLFAQHPHRI